MRVTMQDGESFEAENASAIVDQMRSSGWGLEVSANRYMEKVAENASAATGQPIDTRDALRFLFDLEHAGIVKVEYLTMDEAKQFNEWGSRGWEPDTSPHGDDDDQG
jgi:hypothetical protein